MKSSMFNKILVGSMLLTLALPAVSTARRGKRGGKGPCGQFKCWEMAKGERKSCREKKKQCHRDNWEKKLAKFEADGIPEMKKTKMTERLQKQIERKKAQSEELAKDITFFEETLKKVQGLKTKAKAQ